MPVYEAGQVGPVCYIVSAYCPGPTLGEWLRRQHGAVPVRDGADLVAVLAEALQHAHDRGVIHRDLKPGNVLLAPAGRDAFPAARDRLRPGQDALRRRGRDPNAQRRGPRHARLHGAGQARAGASHAGPAADVYISVRFSTSC